MGSSSPWSSAPPAARHRAAYADATPRAFWLDRLSERVPQPPLDGRADAELCIVGGGFTGLWAALQAKAADPARDVVLLEARTVAFGASGRNGGFCVRTLTHGLENGLARFADEMTLLEREGRTNFDGLLADLRRYGIDCDLELTGELTPSLAAHQDPWIADSAALHERWGYDVKVFPDADSMQAEIASPLYRGGVWVRDGGAVLDPAKLAVGLLGAALACGVRVHEHSPVVALDANGAQMVLATSQGSVRAQRVLLATSAFPPLLRRLRSFVAPVYDYALMSEPLSAAQREAIGWRRRQGIGDAGNQFHYYRQSGDGRVLWGGFDAVYRFGGPVRDALDEHDATFGRLAQNFFTTFPQLEGLRFTHRWGGAIDTCSRFSVFFGTAYRGRVAYVAGYTGLGVASTRWGAQVALDLLDGRRTDVTESRYVRRRPLPFPPEPLRMAVIALTRNRLAAADQHAGRRGWWLSLLDRLGLGFDS